jgi:hypothetical protein
MREVQEAARLNGRKATRVKGDIRKIVEQDNVEKLLGRGLLEGVDRYGKPLAPMAKSTYQNPKRGLGPVLVPRGLNSRFITNFKTLWQDAGDGLTVLVMRYVNIVNKKGQSFAQFHLTGAKKPGTKWVLPKRDVGGITPQGWARIQARFKQFAGDVLKGGS